MGKKKLPPAVSTAEIMKMIGESSHSKYRDAPESGLEDAADVARFREHVGGMGKKPAAKAAASD